MSADNCLFCKIAAGAIPAKIIQKTDTCIAFEDISPKAPMHVLVIPHKHIHSVNELSIEDASLVGEMVLLAKAIAHEKGYSQSGYRLVMNTGAHAGQSVFHIHLHVLGGRGLDWPPG